MEAEEVRQHLETIQKEDKDRVQWLQVLSPNPLVSDQSLISAKKLLTAYSEAVHSLKNAVTDAENQKIASRVWSENNKELHLKLEGLQRSIDRSAFVLVLIDADNDGYVFDDKYLLRGTDGGREAALALKSELQREFRKESPSIAELPFVLKLYANVDKLAMAMSQHGMHEGSSCLRDFCRGFCQTGGLSEFIDVGDGDDRADHQIKGVLQHFQENPCCKHIVLGSCHDNGYVCQLDVIGSDSSLRDRITLLKSFQTGRQYGNLPFRTMRLPSLFRMQAFPTSAIKDGAKIGTALTTPGLSYAVRAGASDGFPVEPAPPSPTFSINRNRILVNAGGERLDRPIEKPTQFAFENFYSKKRKLEATGKRGPCNFHYLGGGCTMTVFSCQYWHGGFGKAEVNVLQWFMRHQPCENGLRCKSAKCFYGHSCRNCKPSCKFSPEMHGVNRTGEREVPSE